MNVQREYIGGTAYVKYKCSECMSGGFFAVSSIGKGNRS